MSRRSNCAAGDAVGSPRDRGGWFLRWIGGRVNQCAVTPQSDPSLAQGEGSARGLGRLKLSWGKGCQVSWCWRALLLWGLTSAAGAPIRITGSDLLGLPFIKACYTQAGQVGLSLALALDGSRPGLEELKLGRADLALVVLPAGEADRLVGWVVRPLGYHAIFAMVPAACPVEKVTLGNLRAVFGIQSDEAKGTRRYWRDLGAGGAWGEAVLTLVAPENGAGITLEYFRSAVLGAQGLQAKVERFSDLADLRTFFLGESRALALGPRMPVGASRIKALRIAVREEDAGVAPSTETLQDGTYPLGLPLQVVYRSERARDLLGVFEFLFSESVAALLTRAEVIPLSAEVRGQAWRSVQAEVARSN
ncbi:MAG: hypothetical protein RL077_1419 [Verrucomicrobiota bacterium]